MSAWRRPSSWCGTACAVLVGVPSTLMTCAGRGFRLPVPQSSGWLLWLCCFPGQTAKPTHDHAIALQTCAQWEAQQQRTRRLGRQGDLGEREREALLAEYLIRGVVGGPWLQYLPLLSDHDGWGQLLILREAGTSAWPPHTDGASQRLRECAALKCSTASRSSPGTPRVVASGCTQGCLPSPAANRAVPGFPLSCWSVLHCQPHHGPLVFTVLRPPAPSRPGPSQPMATERASHHDRDAHSPRLFGAR
jgi:hypothetical protein